MKRIICLLLVLVLALAFVGCGEDKKNVSSQGSGDIDRYAEVGEIPELEVKLGTAIDEVKRIYPADYEDADESKVLLQEVEGNLAVRLDTLNASFYYEKANIDHGVSVITVTNGYAYGFELGSTVTKSDVTAELKAEYTESIATAEQQYFFHGVSDDCDILSCTYDSYRLDFFFVEDFLVAATLTDTNYWTD